MKIIKNGKKQPGNLTYNVTFLNVTRCVILLYCCKCVFHLSAVSRYQYLYVESDAICLLFADFSQKHCPVL